MGKWFKRQSGTVKGMIILGLVLIIGIILRWDYIRAELSLTFGNMFSSPEKIEQVETVNTRQP